MRGSRNFRQGGGQGQSDKKTFFFGPQLILQKSNGRFQRNLSFFKVPEGVQHFPGGSNFFQGGSNCLFPIETHVTCDFPGGVRTPCPPPPPRPLDPHLLFKQFDLGLFCLHMEFLFELFGSGTYKSLLLALIPLRN